MQRFPFLLRRSLRLLIPAGLLLMLLSFVLLSYVWLSTASYRFDSPESVPQTRVAIVFGAGIRDGRVSRVLADRLDTAIALYELDRVQKLLMTGDNSRSDYDEVSAMKAYAIEHGVAPDDITLDYAGFSTYDSCYRAQAIFGVGQAVLVTQPFHLPRAVYTCRALGIDALGIQTDRNIGWLWYNLRELVAGPRALWQVHITRPLPHFLGPREEIT
jgi:vancomycin permeability regulator SanA